MGWRRKLEVGCGGGIALLVAIGVGVWIWAPWVPPIVVTQPGPEGRRVDDGTLLGNYYPGRGGGRRAALLVLGGSEGGIGGGITKISMSLARQGFTILNLSYFRAPGQPRKLEEIPLETFDRAIQWMRLQPEVAADRIGVLGGSKGAEAALLIATRHPELRAVVATMPSSVIWAGVNWKTFISHPSSWSLDGRPLDYLRLASFDRKTVSSVYREVLSPSKAQERAAIPVERIAAPVLLVCGEDDTMWPSCSMARQLEMRATRFGHPRVTVLAYPNAGHAVFGPPLSYRRLANSNLKGLGGTNVGNNHARADDWVRTIAFLKANLAPRHEWKIARGESLPQTSRTRAFARRTYFLSKPASSRPVTAIGSATDPGPIARSPPGH